LGDQSAVSACVTKKNSRMEWDLPLPFPMSAWDFLAFKRTVLKIIHLMVEPAQFTRNKKAEDLLLYWGSG